MHSGIAHLAIAIIILLLSSGCKTGLFDSNELSAFSMEPLNASEMMFALENDRELSRRIWRRGIFIPF